jgi:hypothetical protein
MQSVIIFATFGHAYTNYGVIASIFTFYNCYILLCLAVIYVFASINDNLISCCLTEDINEFKIAVRLITFGTAV